MKITVMSPHGSFALTDWTPEQRLLDACLTNRIPSGSVSVYRVMSGRLELVTNMLKSIADLSDGGKVDLVIRPDRNINYQEIVDRPIVSDVHPGDVSEYFFRDGSDRTLHKGFTSSECTSFVNSRVRRFVDDHAPELRNTTCVVGVSGGGDSNTLLGALVEAGVQTVHPVMMMGIPDWDKGRARAEALCKGHGLKLHIVDSAEVATLLGMKRSRDWVTEFERAYPNTDLEVLGTLAIRLTLSSVARQVGSTQIATGLNLEDLLGEGLMRVMQGVLPLPFPRRTIDGITINYPLYQCPKKIIDGCYPKFSLENYEDRYPSILPGRAILYYMAQSMNTSIPGIEFDFLNGLQKLSESCSSEEFSRNPLFGFSTIGTVSLEQQKRWQNFIRGAA